MILVGTLRARSNTSGWGGLCKCLGVKFPGQNRVALGKDLLVALVIDLNQIELKRPWCSSTWKRRGIKI